MHEAAANCKHGKDEHGTGCKKPDGPKKSKQKIPVKPRPRPGPIRREPHPHTVPLQRPPPEPKTHKWEVWPPRPGIDCEFYDDDYTDVPYDNKIMPWCDIDYSKEPLCKCFCNC